VIQVQTIVSVRSTGIIITSQVALWYSEAWRRFALSESLLFTSPPLVYKVLQGACLSVYMYVCI